MNICKATLDKVAPLKQKYVRSNHSPFLNKEILKAIMNRTRLKNKFLGNRSSEDRSAYSQQRNFCLSLVRKAKKDYYNNIDYKKVTDNKSFWRTVKPLFSQKNSSFSKITLIENELLLNDGEKISSTLNDFFSNVVSNLNIPPYEDPSVNPDQFEDPVLKANEKYKYHSSIKEKNLNKTFTFQTISKSDIKKEFLRLDNSKAIQESDKPTKIIKQNLDVSIKKVSVLRKIIIGLSVSYLFYQSFLKNACINKFLAILMIYFLNISVDLEKFLVHNIAYLLL